MLKGFDAEKNAYALNLTMRPSNSTKNMRQKDSLSRSPPPPSSCSPMSPSAWVLGPDNQSEMMLGRSNSNEFFEDCLSFRGGLDFADTLRVIPISPMMGDSVDETWDFDFDEGRGGTTVHTSRKARVTPVTVTLPTLSVSPRSEKQQVSLFSPLSVASSSSAARLACSNDVKCAEGGRGEVQFPVSHGESLMGADSSRIQSARSRGSRARGRVGGKHSMEMQRGIQGVKEGRCEGEAMVQDQWASKMIRHHSEPTLRPKGRQGTRSFYNQSGCNSSRDAGPAHLSGGVVPTHVAGVFGQAKRGSGNAVRQNSRRERKKTEAVMLARIV